MKLTVFIICSFVLFVALFNSSCVDQNRSSENNMPVKNSEKVDSSTFAIISLDQAFDSVSNLSRSQFYPNAMELQAVDSMLRIAVLDHKGLLAQDKIGHPRMLEFSMYYRQYVPFIQGGVKYVWVNCFCHSQSFANWKREIVAVKDGGNCYFTCYIDLTNMMYKTFISNGEA